jgi:hypothetical protein
MSFAAFGDRESGLSLSRPLLRCRSRLDSKSAGLNTRVGSTPTFGRLFQEKPTPNFGVDFFSWMTYG